MRIILDDACGVELPEGAPRPNVESAKWLLINRFRWLWQIDKITGKGGGMAVSEVVEGLLLAADSERREQAKKILDQLPAEAKAGARKGGFLL